MSINKERVMKEFDSEKEASEWMYNEALEDEHCVDNYRFAFQDDSVSVNKYMNAENAGCCGFFDEDIMVAGRLAKIGCNFGH